MDAFVAAPSLGASGGGVAKKKKVVTVMDEETGEEFTKTIWVDDDGNEVAPGSASAALGEKTNAKAAAGDAPPAKKAPKAPTGGGIASFFGKK